MTRKNSFGKAHSAQYFLLGLCLILGSALFLVFLTSPCIVYIYFIIWDEIQFYFNNYISYIPFTTPEFIFQYTPSFYYHGLCVESRFGKSDVMSRPPVSGWFQTHKFRLFRPNETILARGTELPRVWSIWALKVEFTTILEHLSIEIELESL